MSLFINEDESNRIGTVVSGNSAEPGVAPPTEHSVPEALFQITVTAGGTVVGGTLMELIRRGLLKKEVKPAQIHITQGQLQEACAEAEEASPTAEKPEVKLV